MNPIFRRKFLLLMLAIASLAPTVRAQQSADAYVARYEYLIYLPEGYHEDTTRQWPLMIFLHGAGETGNDLEKLKVHGPSKMIAEGHSFPFIVVSPQAPEYGWDAYVIKIMEQVLRQHRVDEERIYLTGLSMGGFGTWKLAQENPGLFAAIIPICGGGDPEKAWMLSHTPVWCFHGEKDNIVPIENSQRMVDALRPYNPGVKFTVYPEALHDSWTETYNNPEIYDWLLSHKRFRFEEIPMTAAELREYEGIYSVDTGNGEFTVRLNGDRLELKNGERDPFDFKPYGKDSFFIKPEWNEYFGFERDEAGRITGFTLYSASGGRKTFFRKQ